MEQDYYAVLGVAPDADLETIRRAFLAEARGAHPDRGGSHKRMVLVNEAWEILSNAEMRQAYDAHRANVRNERQDDFEETRRTAHRKANDYPRDWSTFEKWMNGLAKDFTEAKFEAKEAMSISWPNAKDSFSGWLFIIGGGILGFYLAAPFLPVNPKPSGIMPRIILVLAAVAVCGGAWIGVLAHLGLGYVLREWPKWKAVIDQIREQIQAQRKTLKSAVIACNNCGQKLRVPTSDEELLVTCGKCRHRFNYRKS